MARREKPDEEPSDETPPVDSQRGRRLESVIPDLIRKAVLGGYDRASGAQESIKTFLHESKLPKEIVSAIFAQIDDTKNGLFRVVAKEVRGFLEAIDFQNELQKLLTTVSFEIKTEIRFIPNDSTPGKLGRPEVKADMKVRRRGRRGSDHGKEPEDRAEIPPPPREVEEPPPNAEANVEDASRGEGEDEDPLS